MENVVQKCIGCNKTPDELEEYIEGALDYEMSIYQYVEEEEGTYNRKNGHFLCTDCYIEAGMPTSGGGGWKAP